MVTITATVSGRRANGDAFTHDTGAVRVAQDGTQVRLEVLDREGGRVVVVRLNEPAAEVVEQAIKTTRRMTK